MSNSSKTPTLRLIILFSDKNLFIHQSFPCILHLYFCIFFWVSDIIHISGSQKEINSNLNWEPLAYFLEENAPDQRILLLSLRCSLWMWPQNSRLVSQLPSDTLTCWTTCRQISIDITYVMASRTLHCMTVVNIPYQRWFL